MGEGKLQGFLMPKRNDPESEKKTARQRELERKVLIYLRSQDGPVTGRRYPFILILTKQVTLVLFFISWKTNSISGRWKELRRDHQAGIETPGICNVLIPPGS
jgi:hypothetical protein